MEKQKVRSVLGGEKYLIGKRGGCQNIYLANIYPFHICKFAIFQEDDDCIFAQLSWAWTNGS